MIIKLFYEQFMFSIRTYFIEKISTGLKKHTIRGEEYSVLPFPVNAIHEPNDASKNVANETGIYSPIFGYEKITVKYIKKDHPLYSTHGYSPLIIIDSRILEEDEAITVALNDGFNTWDMFRARFHKNCDKVILHFTPLRYG